MADPDYASDIELDDDSFDSDIDSEDDFPEFEVQIVDDSESNKENINPQTGMGIGTYCMRCKKKTGNKQSKMVTAKNKRKMNVSKCSKCGCKKCCFVKGKKGGKIANNLTTDLNGNVRDLNLMRDMRIMQQEIFENHILLGQFEQANAFYAAGYRPRRRFYNIMVREMNNNPHNEHYRRVVEYMNR